MLMMELLSTRIEVNFPRKNDRHLLPVPLVSKMKLFETKTRFIKVDRPFNQ